MKLGISLNILGPPFLNTRMLAFQQKRFSGPLPELQRTMPACQGWRSTRSTRRAHELWPSQDISCEWPSIKNFSLGGRKSWKKREKMWKKVEKCARRLHTISTIWESTLRSELTGKRGRGRHLYTSTSRTQRRRLSEIWLTAQCYRQQPSDTILTIRQDVTPSKANGAIDRRAGGAGGLFRKFKSASS
jgi:hypothetical protein